VQSRFSRNQSNRTGTMTLNDKQVARLHWLEAWNHPRKWKRPWHGSRSDGNDHFENQLLIEEQL
jgi:hypothetical protein